jgi:hypothetical protein
MIDEKCLGWRVKVMDFNGLKKMDTRLHGIELNGTATADQKGIA